MKSRLLFPIGMLLWGIALTAQTPKDVKYHFTEAASLTMTGQLFPDNPNPYHRVDTTRFKGFTVDENREVRQPTGMACAFKTNSTTITVQSEFGTLFHAMTTTPLAVRGYDLYIKRNGKWLFADNGVSPDGDMGRNVVIISDMDGKEKECLLYFPLGTEVRGVKIGVQEGAYIQPIDNPFSHQIVFWGSSFTHGVSTSRPGMSYPSQLGRATGLHAVNFGCSGRCMLQSYFCDVLCAVDADAFVFDTFSNPGIEQVEERLFPFIEQLQKAHPGVPLIFQHTIYRERRNFSLSNEDFEGRRERRVAELMEEAMRRYPDVYFIQQNSATSPTHETSVDGTHPGDYGYTLWATTLKKPLLKILRKYGIKPNK